MIPEQIEYLESMVKNARLLKKERNFYNSEQNSLSQSLNYTLDSIKIIFTNYPSVSLPCRVESRVSKFLHEAMMDIVDSAVKIIEAEISETEIIQPRDISAKLEEIQKEFDAKLQTKTKRGFFK